jgi:hypothetical protein
MLSDQAIHLLNEAGTAAHPVIAEAFGGAPHDKRVRLLQVLARAPGRDSIRPFVQALTTPENTEAASRIAAEAATRLAPSLQTQFRDALRQALEQPLADESVAAALSLLAKLDRGGARAQLFKFVGDKSSPFVRSAALRALAGQRLTAVQVKGFLDVLEDQEQRDVHEAVRELLGAMPEWPAGLAGVLKRLLTARNPEQRLFALRALRTSPSPDLVRLALKLRDHHDPRFRAAAEEVLATNKHAVEPLIRLLQLGKDPVEGRRLAGLLARHGSTMSPKQVRAIADRAVKLMITNPTAGDLLCDVAIAAGGARLVPFLADKAVRWRRSRRYPQALHLLAKLASAKLLDGEGSYQLALTRFLQSVARPGQDDGSPGNAAMGFFAVLLRDGFPLLNRLKKETSLGPEHLLRLASYFAEAVGPERRFGAELLQHLATRHKGRTGEEARYALRTAGL